MQNLQQRRGNLTRRLAVRQPTETRTRAQLVSNIEQLNKQIRNLQQNLFNKLVKTAAATKIQSRVRGMLTRSKLYNPGTAVGRARLERLFNNTPRGAYVRRFGPERHVTTRANRARNQMARCTGRVCSMHR